MYKIQRPLRKFWQDISKDLIQKIYIMRIRNLTLFLVFILAISAEVQNNVVTNTTSKDSIVLEMELLQQQIELNEKKISLLQQLRSYYIKNNLTIPEINENILSQTVSFMGSNRISSHISGYPGIADHAPAYGQVRERSDMNFMSKIFKKLTLSFNNTIKEMNYLSTKGYQRTPEDPSSAFIMVFLTNSNDLILRDMNGNILITLTADYEIVKMSVSPFTDEYYIVTVGADMRLRLYNVIPHRVRIDQKNETSNKKEKPKFMQTFQIVLDYVYDLTNNQMLSNDTQVEKRVGEQGVVFLGSVLARSNKYIVVADAEGSITFINRNGTYRGTQKASDTSVIGIFKFYPNPLVATRNSLGFFNPNMMQVANPPCDLPGDPILSVEVDQFSTSNFYALLETGEILIYDNKQSNPACKIVSKRIAFNGRTDNDTYHVYGAKGFLFVQKGETGIHLIAHNISDVIYGQNEESEFYNISLYPYRDSQDKVVRGKYFTQRNTYVSTYIGAYFEFENGTSAFALYDLSTPIKQTNDWFSNIRFPIIIIAIFLVMAYQFWSRKQKKDKDDFDKLEKLSRYKFDEGSHGKSGKGSKDLSSLKHELDSLTKQSRSLEEHLGQLPIGNRGKASTSRAKYEDENDDDDDNERIQEIAYSKKNQ